MKYTIEGFSQQELINLKMDLTDTLILRWFIDFKDTGKMAYEILNNDKYYWVKYEAVLNDLPILNVDKRTVARRFIKMAESGVLKHFTKRVKGTFSMYAVGEEYAILVSNEQTQENQGETEGVGFQTPRGGISNADQKIILLNNPSINNQSIKDIYLETFTYYLSKSNLIKHKEFTEPMKKAIDKAIKTYNLDFEYIKRIIDRHSEKVEATKDKGEYKTKVRTLAELFGQKKYQSQDFICVDYLDEVYTTLVKKETEKTREELNKESEAEYGF